MADAIYSALALAAVAAAASAGDATMTNPPPINMAMTTQGSGIRLTVSGASISPFEATYVLDVTSDSGGGNNHSLQRGRVRLVPGKKVTLITLDLGNLHTGKWTATLQVDAAGGGSYRQNLNSGSTQPETIVD